MLLFSFEIISITGYINSMFYVYKITNRVNKKVYIGKTDDVLKRWDKHVRISLRPNGRNYHLIHRAISKYGLDNFTIETIDTSDTEQESLNKEIYWIDFYKSNVAKYGKESGYNLTAGGEGISGFKHSEEARKAMSIARAGEKNAFYGKTHTDSVKRQLSIIKKEYFSTHENNFKGKTHSEETRKFLSENQIGLHAGEKHPNAKLTEDNIHIVFQLLIEGYSYAEIARKMQVSKGLIASIKKGRSWKHIPRPSELLSVLKREN
jgi:group I intron endonuclease